MLSAFFAAGLFLFGASPGSNHLNDFGQLTFDSSEQRNVCLYLEKGQGAIVFIEQVEGSFYASLLAPDDSLIERKASVHFSDLALMFEWTAEVEGNYSFLIEPVRNDGTYALSLEFLGDHQQRLQQLKQDARFLSVKKNLKTVRSIDPNDTEFSDLQFLKEVIGDKPYVFLGEQTHRETESLAAKTRLVKFLHQEIGFDVLAWESDLYATAKLSEAIFQQNVSDDLWGSGLNGNWSPLKGIDPIRKYLISEAQSERPLQLWGVDGQFYDYISIDFFVEDLKKVLFENNIKDSEDVYFEIVQKAIHRKYMNNKEPAPTKDQIEMVKTTTLRLRDELLSIAEDDLEVSMWVQLMESLSLFWEDGFKQGWLRQRDKIMADNFYWLAKKRYPGKKIIFWGASSHLGRNRSLEKKATKYTRSSFIPAGTIIDKLLPGEVYIIFCTALHGEIAPAHVEKDRNSDAWLRYMVQPNQHPEFELEEMMGMTDAAYGFLDLKAGTGDLAWLNEPAIARPFGYITSSAPWPRITDGFFFIREVSSVSYADWVDSWLKRMQAKKKASQN